MKMVPLGEVADLQFGGAFKSARFNTAGQGLPIVRIRDVKSGRSTTYYSGSYEEKLVVRDGDFLIGMDGEFNLGKWQGGRALLNQRVCRIGELQPNVDLGYLVHFLPRELKKIEDRTSFATVKHLSAGKLKVIGVPLPPLDEQRRIAAILDKADTIRQKRRQAISDLDTLAQSIFHEMFGTPSEWTSRWDSTTVGELAIRITDGAHRTPKRQSSGVPLLSARNIQNGWIDFANTDFVGQEEYSRLKKRVDPERGDILLSCSGTIGRVATVSSSLPLTLVRSVALVRPLNSVDTSFLAALLSTYTLQREMQRQANSSAQANLFQNQISRLPGFAPPGHLQKEFTLRTSRIVDAQAKLTKLEKHSSTLFASLQSRAFRGEL